MDTKTTAILALDIQNGILQMVPGADAILKQAQQIIEFGREKRVLIIHVGLGFEPGYPEIPDGHMFARVKESGLFLKGTPSAEPPSGFKQAGDLTIYKQRVSGFSENQLDMVLRAKGIKTLVLMGIATSGIVLSTLRQAFDKDYKCIVIKDACLDRDPEVHRVLTEKVFANQATVVTADEFTR